MNSEQRDGISQRSSMKRIRLITAACLALCAPPLLLLSFTLGQKFGVKVDEVLINVLVVDRNGTPITGLQKEDFRVYEERVEQQISNFFLVDAPFNLGLTLDSSQSTEGKLRQIQAAAAGFVEDLHPDDEVMVLSFDSEVYLDSDFTQDRDNLDRAIRSTRTGGNETHLYEAVYLGLEQLQSRPFRKVMVLFTDGMDVGSQDASNSETIEMARESEVLIYTIFFNTLEDAIDRALGLGGVGTARTTPGTFPGSAPIPVPDPFPTTRPTVSPVERERIRQQLQTQYLMAERYLRDLAEATGGRSFEVKSDLQNLHQSFDQILAELRTLYTLTYVPSAKEGTGFREVKVQVDRQGARVRHRPGYLVNDP